MGEPLKQLRLAAIIGAISLLAMVIGQQATVWQINRETLRNREIGFGLRQEVNVMQGIADENRTLIKGLAPTTDRWTKTQHDEWVKELRRINPQLQLPKDK